MILNLLLNEQRRIVAYLDSFPLSWDLRQARLASLWKSCCKERKVMAGKYTPLENYLRDLPENQREVTLGFEQIERILNDKLPYSAYESQKWWEHEKEGNHVNARAWSNAGWKVESLDFNEKWVKLIRIG